MKRRIVYAILLLFITTAPYLLAWALQGDDWRFTGFLFGVEDGNSYLGKMRLGGRGIFDFYLFYTPEPHDPVPLVFLPYIVPGYLVGRLISETDPAHTTALILTFHLMRLVFDVLLFIVLDRFIAAFVRSDGARLTALVLATVGGGLGWLVSFTGALPPEFYIPEGFGFLVLFGLPHLALARAALLGGILLLITSAEKEKRSAVSGQQTAESHQNSVLSTQSLALFPALAGLCWLVVGLAVPFYLAILYCILGAWGLAVWIRERRFPTALFIRCVIAGGITLPLFLYYTVAFSANSAFAVWSAQNQLPSPPPLQYVLAYGVIGIPALLGIRRAWQQARSQMRYALLVGWVVIVPVLVYLPINVQRRMAEAVLVPLAILAAIGVAAWAEKNVHRRWLARIWLSAACLSTGLLLLGSILAASNPNRPLFRSVAEAAAFDWLNTYAEADTVVLSAVETGNVLAAYTHLRPFVGHGPETLDWQQKTALVRQFFSGGMSASQREALYDATCLESQPTLCAAPIEYLFYGTLERAMTQDDAPPDWLDEWTLIYDQNDYRIYERAGE